MIYHDNLLLLVIEADFFGGIDTIVDFNESDGYKPWYSISLNNMLNMTHNTTYTIF